MLVLFQPRGDINLSATESNIYVGAYTDIDITRAEIHSSSFFGLISTIRNHTVGDRIATGTQALANLNNSLVSGANTMLVGAQLSAGHDLNLNVGGDLIVVAAISSQREWFFERKVGRCSPPPSPRNSSSKPPPT
ncbi:hypothetical protein AAFO92_14000 [Roseovarius sp. CAU 1744]|uniref:hypothetical protein n=1 Tax=Roseovarius sp. CAU 1744 TaxID=3140368 RepID=UPI00325A6BF1